MVPYSKYGFQEDLATVFSDLELPVVYENPESKWSVALPDDSVMHVLVRKIEEELKRGVIPNVVGMNAKDAMYLLENAGVQVNIIGRGMIVKQSIIPGTKIYKGTEILLQLS